MADSNDTQSPGMPMFPDPVNPDDLGRGPMVVGLFWTFGALALIVVAVRIWVRLTIMRILNTVCISFLTVAFHYGLGKHDRDLTCDQTVNVIKWTWLNSTPGITCSILARTSIAILLVRIFGRKAWLKWFLQCGDILNIAKVAGVEQVVSSTTLGVSMLDDGVAVSNGSRTPASTSIPFYAPPSMANFLEPKVKRYAKIRDKRSWTTSMTAETEFPIVDHEDIAKFAVAAFQDPEKYHRRALGLASHQLKIQDMLDQLAEAAGQPSTIRAKFLTDEEVEVQAKASGFSNSHKALRLTSNYVNLKELAEIVPLTSFKDFLKREKDLMMKTFPTRAS